jgi:quercetin 2,3-dioxygenase
MSKKISVFSAITTGFPWHTQDPFLFCAHHDDAYPAGNAQLGPVASLAGRSIGQDFSRTNGWSMYHGQTVPGFPSHPHRGFETVTIVRQGLIDHSDSLGASARFGNGDVQWLTAGKGIVHCEMFPLLNSTAPNPLELFQIWLNLPAKNKMVDPHFTMQWGDQVAQIKIADEQGHGTVIKVVTGNLGAAMNHAKPMPAPPDSWAAQPEADVAICTIKMDAGARFKLPPCKSNETRRNMYFFKGQSVTVAEQLLKSHAAFALDPTQAIEFINGDTESEFLLLQGKPIAEPVAQHGPFVMNTQDEILQAIQDYQRTQFGGWPWQGSEPVHGSGEERFAKHPDGTIEYPHPSPEHAGAAHTLTSASDANAATS